MSCEILCTDLKFSRSHYHSFDYELAKEVAQEHLPIEGSAYIRSISYISSFSKSYPVF